MPLRLQVETPEFTSWQHLVTSIACFLVGGSNPSLFACLYNNELPQVCLSGQVCRVGNLSLCDIITGKVTGVFSVITNQMLVSWKNTCILHHSWVTMFPAAPWSVCVLSPDVYVYVTKPLVCSPSRPAADGGPHAVPCRLGFREGDRILRPRGLALQAGSVLAWLGVLRSNRRNAGILPVCCSVRAGWDRHLQR